MTATIAHVNVARGYRGGERQTELLIRGLAARGFRQVLVARRDGPLAARFGDLDIEVRRVRGGVLSTFRATAGADIVHVHEGRSPYAAWLRSLASGTPYALTRRVPNRVGEHVFAHRAYRRAAFVAAVSPQVRDVMHAFDPAITLCVVPDCSSGLPHDQAVSAGIRAALPGSVVCGHVAALDAHKGQELIIEVARRLGASHPEVCFVLVGGGAEEARLKALAAGLTNVVFTGFVDNVGDYLAAFDIFVFPSHREGLGSVLIDAMEYGLPIVATRVGGIPFIVEEGYNGLLVDAGSAPQLTAAVERLLGSATLRHEMGRNGRERSARFTAAAMVDSYAALYRTILPGNRASVAA